MSMKMDFVNEKAMSMKLMTQMESIKLNFLQAWMKIINTHIKYFHPCDQ